MLAWLTPDDAPDGLKCIRLLVPSGEEWETIIRGALVPLFDSVNFEQYGSYTPEETAEVFLSCMAQWMKWEGCVSVGTVLYTAGDTKPDFALWCEGQQVAQADYPELYAALGDTWGSADSGYFRLPDLRDCFALGSSGGTAGSYALGDTGGAETHTLAESEMPNHKHVTTLGAQLAQLGAGSGVLSYLPVPPYMANTSYVGGGGAHNNMPPYATLNAYIIVR